MARSDRGRDGGAGGCAAVRTDPGRVASMVVVTSVTVGGGTDGSVGFVTTS